MQIHRICKRNSMNFLPLFTRRSLSHLVIHGSVSTCTISMKNIAEDTKHGHSVWQQQYCIVFLKCYLKYTRNIRLFDWYVILRKQVRWGIFNVDALRLKLLLYFSAEMWIPVNSLQLTTILKYNIWSANFTKPISGTHPLEHIWQIYNAGAIPGVCSFSWNFDIFLVNSQKVGVQAPENIELKNWFSTWHSLHFFSLFTSQYFTTLSQSSSPISSKCSAILKIDF